jgi:murein DD-endopeptidase MepM/ murein hydrolase activator NlpD
MNIVPRAHLRQAALALLIATALISACTPPGGAGLRSAVKPNPVAQMIVDAQLADPEITALPRAEDASTPDVQPMPDVQATPAPLRLTLPTPGAAPVSLWRPALYRAPWALGPYDHFYFSRPIAADEVNWPLADYRYGGIFPGTDIVHTGIDIGASKGTPIMAAAAGTVVWADFGLFSGTRDENDPYGKAVAIKHDFGWDGKRLYTIYAHMDRIDVAAGQVVQAGEQIGLVGETGNVTGPHLHFEVRVKSNSFFTTLNPELWLAPPQGWGVLVGSLKNTNGSILTAQEVVVRSLDSGRRWIVRSYGPKVANSDPYYQENLVLSDLPGGSYEVVINYLDELYRLNVEVQPGAITYFSFRGSSAYQTSLPATPSPEEWLNGADLP